MTGACIPLLRAPFHKFQLALAAPDSVQTRNLRKQHNHKHTGQTHLAGCIAVSLELIPNPFKFKTSWKLWPQRSNLPCWSMLLGVSFIPSVLSWIPLLYNKGRRRKIKQKLNKQTKQNFSFLWSVLPWPGQSMNAGTHLPEITPLTPPSIHYGKSQGWLICNSSEGLKSPKPSASLA